MVTFGKFLMVTLSTTIVVSRLLLFDPVTSHAVMNTPVTITMSEKAWVGLLYHLKDTVNAIPISIIEPDPYQAVNITIAKIEQQLNSR